jgi:hypothetical protein
MYNQQNIYQQQNQQPQQQGINYSPNPGYFQTNNSFYGVQPIQQQPNYFSNQQPQIQQPNYFVPVSGGNSQINFVPQNLKKNSFDGVSSFTDQVGSFNGGIGNSNFVGSLKPNSFFDHQQPQEQNVFQPQFQQNTFLQQNDQPKHIYYEDKSNVNHSMSFENIYGENLYQQQSKQFDQNSSNVSYTMNQIPEDIVSPNAPNAPDLRYFCLFLNLKF